MPADSPAPASDVLAGLRERIDDVDGRLLEAMAERARIATLVGETKLAADPASGGAPVHRPAREASLIRSLMGRYEGPMDRRAIHAIWRELIGASTAIQKPLIIATADTTMEMTARAHFGTSHTYLWAATPIATVAVGDADIGLFETSDVESWQTAVDLLIARDDCHLLWRLPFTISAGGWIAVGRGVPDDSGLDQTIFYSDDSSLANDPAVEVVCASEDSGAVLSIAGAYDDATLPIALGLPKGEDAPVQRLGQWPAPLEI